MENNKACIFQIKQHMEAYPHGTVFAAIDFFDYGSSTAMRTALSKLVRQGYCCRIMPSIFYLPCDETQIDPHDVAIAIARNRNWSIVPSGDYALYLLGLSPNKPAELTFDSTGPTIDLDIIGNTLRFRKCIAKYLTSMDYKSALVVSALRSMHRSGFEIESATLRQIASKLSSDECRVLFLAKDCTYKFIQSYIERICSSM